MGKTEVPPARAALLAARADIAERIEDAAATLRRMPDKEKSMLLNGERGQAWPVMLHTAAEHAAWAPRPVRRPPATSQQIDRMDEALDWLLVLARQKRDYFRAVWLMCAERKKSGEAAKILGCNRDTARIWCDAGLDRIIHHRSVPTPEALKLRESLKQGMHHPQRKTG
jgi:hypothetical protein